MPESEGGGGELIVHVRIQGFAVVVAVAREQGTDAERLHEGSAWGGGEGLIMYTINKILIMYTLFP